MMYVLSLCSGVGLLDLAMERAGMTIAGQVEIDPWNRSVLAYHWPNVKRMNDIKEVTGDEFGAVNIVAGGIPCQPFSAIGQHRGTADDRYLWPEAFRIISHIRPRWVCLENVADFLNVALDNVQADLESEGYQVWAALLPACACNAAHVRQRAVIVAHTPVQRQQRDTTSRWQAGRGIEHASNACDVGNPTCARCASRGIQRGVTSSKKICNMHATNSGDCNDANDLSATPQSRLGRAIDGRASGMDRYPRVALQGEAQYAWEEPRTIATRKNNHANRLKALGNGVYVPQWIEIFSAIVSADHDDTEVA